MLQNKNRFIQQLRQNRTLQFLNLCEDRHSAQGADKCTVTRQYQRTCRMPHVVACYLTLQNHIASNKHSVPFIYFELTLAPTIVSTLCSNKNRVAKMLDISSCGSRDHASKQSAQHSKRRAKCIRKIPARTHISLCERRGCKVDQSTCRAFVRLGYWMICCSKAVVSSDSMLAFSYKMKPECIHDSLTLPGG